MNRIVQSTLAAPVAALLGAALIATAPTRAAAESTSGADYAEELVRSVYYEGLPHAEAAAIDAEGAERLVEMLAETDQAPYHANILLALGICAQPAAYEAIASYAGRPLAGPVDRTTFRNQLAAPQAMGYLAEREPRAVGWLAAAANRSNDPGWAFGRVNSSRVGHMLRRRAITGLALSGRPEAAQLLRQLDAGLGSGPKTDPELRGHLRDALALHARVAAKGPSFAAGVAP